MKISFFHDNFITNDNGKLYSNGSLNETVIKRYKKLSDRLILVTRYDNRRDSKNLSFVSKDSELNFIPISNFISIKFYRLFSAITDIKNVIKISDHIVVRLPSFIGLLTLFLASNKKNIIVELVGCPLDTFKNHSKVGRVISYFMYILTRYFVRNASNVVYVTKFYLQKKYPTNTKNFLSCSDVEIIVSENLNDERFSKIKEKTNSFVIGMIGNLNSKYKGFDIALKTLKLLVETNNSNFTLELVGGGKNKKIEDLIAKYKLQKNVRFIGFRSHPDQIFDWLDKVDFYIHPSKSEGLPRSLIEAMSRGCCCFGSNVGGIPELLDPKYIHSPNDFKRLYNMIIEHIDINERLLNIKKCFEISKNYNKDILDKLRSEFYENYFNSFK